MELDIRTKATLQMLANQRNSAQDTVAQLAGEITALQEELAVLKKRIGELAPPPQQTEGAA